MNNDPVVALVITEVSEPLMEDGGGATLVGIEDGVAQVRYQQGVNEECPECIMSPEDMREYLLEALAVRAPYVRDVTIVEA